MSQRRGDSLDIYGGGARGPPRSQAPPASFSGLSIVQPPGGASSISFGGYGDDQSHRSPSPLYGRRSSQPSQPPPREQQHHHQQQQQQQQRQQFAAVDSTPYSSPAGPRAGRRGRREPYTPEHRPQQAHMNDRFSANTGQYNQHYMGGKNIVQSPGGNSSISLGGYGDTPPVAPPRAAVRPDDSRAGQSEHNPPPAAPSHPGYSPGPQVKPSQHHYYDQQSRGSQYYGPYDGGERSRAAPDHIAPPYGGTPPRGPKSQASRADGAYQQHHMGGKNIVQAPGGSSSMSLSWGHEPDTGRSNAYHAPQAPPPHRPQHNVQDSQFSPNNYEAQQRSSYQAGRYQSPELQSVPTPYNPYQSPAAMSPSHVTQPPGGTSSLNVFG